METLTTTIELKNAFEETPVLYGLDTPRPGDGDGTVEPKKPEPSDPSEEDEDEVRPQTF